LPLNDGAVVLASGALLADDALDAVEPLVVAVPPLELAPPPEPEVVAVDAAVVAAVVPAPRTPPPLLSPPQAAIPMVQANASAAAAVRCGILMWCPSDGGRSRVLPA
jgi:hypothetical protein